MRRLLGLTLLASIVLSGRSFAAPLTADDAVKIALQRSTSIINSEASVLDAKSGVWSAYSGVLPNVSANYNYTKSVTDPQDRRLPHHAGDPARRIARHRFHCRTRFQQLIDRL